MNKQMRGQIVKGVIGVLVILCLGGLFLNQYLKNRSKEIAEREKNNRKREQVESGLNRLVSQYNAIDNWEEILSKGNKTSASKIMTIELERIWLNERPILFIGTIEDISTIDNTTYRIRLGRGLYRRIEYIFFTEFGLELRCSKSEVDDFLKGHQHIFTDIEIFSSVAVIAKINQIKTEFYSGPEGSRKEMRIGVGDCLAIMHVGLSAF
jgi:hypothetical protein